MYCQLAEDIFSEIRSPRSDTFFAKTPPSSPQKKAAPARGEASIGLRAKE
jgi:hypothetical protein